MSSSRWLITPSWLSGSWRYFLYSSVCSCHLFLISSASVRSLPFLSFIEPIFAWNIPLVSLICRLFLLFPTYFFSLITEEGFLISSCYSLELCIQMFISFLFSFAFHFSSFLSYLQALPRQPFCFFAFLFHGDGWSHHPKQGWSHHQNRDGWSLFWSSIKGSLCWSLSPVQRHKPPPTVHQALYQILNLFLISTV